MLVLQHFNDNFKTDSQASKQEATKLTRQQKSNIILYRNWNE